MQKHLAKKHLLGVLKGQTKGLFNQSMSKNRFLVEKDPVRSASSKAGRKEEKRLSVNARAWLSTTGSSFEPLCCGLETLRLGRFGLSDFEHFPVFTTENVVLEKLCLST